MDTLWIDSIDDNDVIVIVQVISNHGNFQPILSLTKLKISLSLRTEPSSSKKCRQAIQ